MITLEFVKKIDENWEKRIISENVANLNEVKCPICGNRVK